MFSIHLAEPEGRQPDGRGFAARLLGKFLGFSAGIVLVVAVDALVLDHQLRQSVSEGFQTAIPSLTHALRGGWANVAGR